MQLFLYHFGSIVQIVPRIQTNNDKDKINQQTHVIPYKEYKNSRNFIQRIQEFIWYSYISY